MSETIRQQAFGQSHRLTVVDRFGVWLSVRQVRKWVADFSGLSVLDAGCGYQARLGSALAEEAQHVTLNDVSLNPLLKNAPNIHCVEAALPNSLKQFEPASFDVILCLSVLEHLWEPEVALEEFQRLLRPGGKCLINVPSWSGKTFLEFSAFRLGLSPAAEMEDHKMYYDPQQLWPMLVKAGFLPSKIRCFKHKFGLNTFAACEKGPISP